MKPKNRSLWLVLTGFVLANLALTGCPDGGGSAPVSATGIDVYDGGGLVTGGEIHLWVQATGSRRSYAQLMANLRPSNTRDSVGWFSDDLAVAAVTDGGMVTAVGMGYAEIVASAGEHEARLTVWVWQDGEGPAPAENISIVGGDLSLPAGGTMRLAVEVYPYGSIVPAVTWESSDWNVATVSSAGLVTGIAAGEAGVVARSVAYPEIYAKVTVRVLDNYFPVLGVSITGGDFYLAMYRSTQLAVTFNPANASDQSLLWESSDQGVATVSAAGLVRAVSLGTVAITATSRANPVATATVEVTIIPPPTGVVPYVWDFHFDSDPSLWDLGQSMTQAFPHTNNMTLFGNHVGVGIAQGIQRQWANLMVRSLHQNQTFFMEIADLPRPFSITVRHRGNSRFLRFYDSGDGGDALVWQSRRSIIGTYFATANFPGTGVATVRVGHGNLFPNSVFIYGVSLSPTLAEIPPVTKVSIDSGDVRLRPGLSHSLPLTVLPEMPPPLAIDMPASNPDLAWEISNPDVVSIEWPLTEDGLLVPYARLYALSNGTAVITARSVSNPERYDTITVIVEEVPPASITISRDVTIPEGGLADLGVITVPFHAGRQLIEWSSSDPSIASVTASGRVMAGIAGTAVIRAASSANPGVYGEVTVTVARGLSSTSWLFNRQSAADAGLQGSFDDIILPRDMDWGNGLFLIAADPPFRPPSVPPATPISRQIRANIQSGGIVGVLQTDTTTPPEFARIEGVTGLVNVELVFSGTGQITEHAIGQFTRFPSIRIGAHGEETLFAYGLYTEGTALRFGSISLAGTGEPIYLIGNASLRIYRLTLTHLPAD